MLHIIYSVYMYRYDTRIGTKKGGGDSAIASSVNVHTEKGRIATLVRVRVWIVVIIAKR